MQRTVWLLKITLKLYTKLGTYLPENASKNQAIIEVEENCDLYVVKEEGEYKDWYVLMCYDYGDSSCEIEVSKNRDDLVG